MEGVIEHIILCLSARRADINVRSAGLLTYRSLHQLSIWWPMQSNNGISPDIRCYSHKILYQSAFECKLSNWHHTCREGAPRSFHHNRERSSIRNNYLKRILANGICQSTPLIPLKHDLLAECIALRKSYRYITPAPQYVIPDLIRDPDQTSDHLSLVRFKQRPPS